MIRDITSFGAVGDGVCDDTAAIAACLAAAGVSGGQVTFPAAQVAWTVSAQLNVPPYVSIVGEDWNASTVRGMVPGGYVFKLSGNPLIERLNIIALAGCVGAVDLSNTSLSQVSYCKVEALDGIALNLKDTYRCQADNVYISAAGTGVRLEDVTTFTFNKGAINGCTSGAIKAAGAFFSAAFRDTSIESNPSPVTCEFGAAATGNLLMDGCAFEDNGAGQADPKVISVGAHIVSLRGNKFGQVSGLAPSGTLIDIAFQDVASMMLDGNEFIQNSGSAGYLRHFIGGPGLKRPLVRRSNVYRSDAMSPADLAECFGFWADYMPRQIIQNDVFYGAGSALAMNEAQPDGASW